jgi:glycosyltransferase involved in cell wall biosynthesis
MSGADILVVLPTLGKRLGTLAQALDSVNHQRHDVGLRSVVIAPPAAVDARRLARAAGADVVDDRNEGLSAAINRGLEARDGEAFYAFLGDDDLFRPGGLKALRALMLVNPAAVLAYGGCDYIAADGRTLGCSSAGAWARFLLPWGPNLIPHPGTLIRLDVLARIGGFDRGLRFAMDLDVLLKLRHYGPFAWTRTAVSAFRWHADSLTVANRTGVSREAELVRRRHLPSALRPFSALWHRPVRFASRLAAGLVNARARVIGDAGESG